MICPFSALHEAITSCPALPSVFCPLPSPILPCPRLFHNLHPAVTARVCYPAAEAAGCGGTACCGRCARHLPRAALPTSLRRLRDVAGPQPEQGGVRNHVQAHPAAHTRPLPAGMHGCECTRCGASCLLCCVHHCTPSKADFPRLGNYMGWLCFFGGVHWCFFPSAS